MWPLGASGAAAGAATAAGAAGAPVAASATGAACCTGACIISGAGGLLTILTLPSPSVISSSEIPDSATRSIRVFSLRRSMDSAFLRGSWPRGSRVGTSQRFDRCLQGQPVADRAESGDHAGGQVGQVRVMPESFAAMDVRQVNFDEGHRDRRKRVAERDAGVRVRGGV